MVHYSHSTCFQVVEFAIQQFKIEALREFMRLERANEGVL